MRYVALTLLLFSGYSNAQERKHIVAAPLNGRPVLLAANDIVRTGAYPSTIHLTGGVEVKSPVCLATGKNGKVICDGYMLLRADEATYHEDTGEIQASGAVSVSPLLHEGKK
jgi:hypothetical protein